MLNNFFNIILQESTLPGLADISSNPYILSSVILILVGVVLPCLVWFIRNFMRIVMKRNYEFLNRSLKWFALGGLVVAILGIILIILVTTGAIHYAK